MQVQPFFKGRPTCVTTLKAQLKALNNRSAMVMSFTLSHLSPVRHSSTVLRQAHYQLHTRMSSSPHRA
jgi:hypothetical protein